MRKLDETAKTTLTGAIREVEARSSAEVVVSVRPHSSHFLHVYLVVGIVAGLALHGFLLYSPWEFSLESLLLYPLAAGLLVAGFCVALPSFGRLFLRRAARRSAVEQAARAMFYDRGVHKTSGRTGILVYLSLREREAAVIPDVGVEQAVPPEAWREKTARLEDVVRRGASAADLAREIVAFADVLEPVLPRSADDVNELPDEVAA